MENDYELKSKNVPRKRRSKLNSALPHTLCWQNISVWSKLKQSQGVFQRTKYKDVQLLNDVSGYVTAGSLVAIMGPSGSGKTTLLATISYRLTDGIFGEVYLNGGTPSRAEMLSISGFVPQEDLSVVSLTVFEHMSFMVASQAKLKMNKRSSELDRMRKILSLMNKLGLDNCESTQLKSLSGGQRKRLSIAVQMLTDPFILFCDEATSGLDSSGAAIVVNMLKKFASRGKIVICSIHQPASGIFELFDDVLLLSTGGRVSYFGPVTKAVEYFERFQMICPESYNIAEFLVKQISISGPDDHERVGILCDTYTSSKEAAIVKEKINSVCFDKHLSSIGMKFLVDRREDVFSLYQKHSYADHRASEQLHLTTQMYYLIWRNLKDVSRNHMNHLVHFMVYIGVALMVSSIYNKIIDNDRDRVQNIRGFVNIIVLETIYEFSYFVLNTFSSERPLLLREISSSLYSVEAYYLSNFISKMVYSVFTSLVFVALVKWLSDIVIFLSYLDLAVTVCVIASMGTAYGCMLSAIFENIGVAITVTTAYELSAYLFAGVTLTISSLPAYISWMKYFSTFYYAIQALTVQEWTSIDLVNVKYYNLSLDDPASFRGLVKVEEYGYSIMDYRNNLYILGVLTILFHLVAYSFIVKRCKKQGAY